MTTTRDVMQKIYKNVSCLQRKAIKACFCCLATIVLSFAVTTQAMARDPDGVYNNSPYKQWFESQHNAFGQYCCNESDGRAYLETYTMNPDGSVTLHDGRILPAYMVLTGPNPTGHAVVWSIGEKYYCFAPGTLG